MSTTTDGSAVTEPNATGGVTAELKQEIQKVVMGIFKDAVPRLIKQSLTESLPSLVEQFGAKSKEENTTKPGDVDSGANDPQRLSLKALEKQVNDLNQQLKKRDEALETERKRVIDTQLRGSVRDAMASLLGADNPLLGMALDSLYDKHQRFVQGDDGQALVKFKGEYGSEDELVSLKDGMKKLAENELKHMLPSRTQTLPGVGGRRGNAIQANGNTKSPIDRMFEGVIAQASSAADPNKP